MAEALYHSEKLADHDRSAFSCGVESLDRYFRQQTSQDQRRGLAQTYVLVETTTGQIVGYYTLSSFAIVPASLLDELTRRLPRYQQYPAMLIGRLALDRRFQDRGFGRRLLYDSLSRCLRLSEEVGSIGVVVDAKDDNARAFYEHVGFQRTIDDPYRLFLPMRSIQALAQGHQ